MLRRQAARYGDRRLFVCDGESAELCASLLTSPRAAAAASRAAGIARGDRVAILCGNRTEFVDLFLGLAWIGAVSVPINVAARGPQLEHMLKTSGARLLVLETEWLAALEFVDFGKLAGRSDLGDRSGCGYAGAAFRAFRCASCPSLRRR